MDYTEAFGKISQFYTDKGKFDAASESFKSGMILIHVFQAKGSNAYFRKASRRHSRLP